MKTPIRAITGICLLMTLGACELLESSDSLPTIPEPGPLPDSTAQAYREDAHQLAVRQLVDEDRDRVDIPEARVERFYNALGTAYNATHIEARDSIIGIHTFARYNLHEIIVGVDSTVPWTQAWQKSERFTGHESIDALVEQYDLTLDNYLGFAPAAVLHSEEAFNPVALSARFEGIPGVRHAEQNGPLGDGNDIQAKILEDALLLYYSRAWGECPAGCVHRTTWTFRIGEEGTVTFEGKTSE